MRTVKSIISVSLAAAMAISMLAGCGTKSNSSKPSSTAQANAGPTKFWYAGEDQNLSKERVELVTKDILEKVNIDLKFDQIARSNYVEKLNVMIASGSFPDAIDSTGIPSLSEAVDAKLLLPLNDVTDKDANWKTIDKKNFLKYTYKNQIYGLPVIIDKPVTIFYREDWLKKLNLSIPTNPEELYNVMKAFTVNDPDGNGKNDTFGLVMNSDYGQTQPFWFMFLPGSPFKDTGFYYDDKEKAVKNVIQLKDDMTKALTWFKKLYSEKILDNQYVLTKQEDEENKFVTGISGTWLKSSGSGISRQVKLQKNVPTAKVNNFPVMTGKYGANIKQTPTGRALYLTKAVNDRLEAGKKAIAYLSGPEGQRNMLQGKEGITYKIDGDKIIWTNPDDAAKYSSASSVTSPFNIPPIVKDPLLSQSMDNIKGYEIMASVELSENETYKKSGADMKKVYSEGITKIIIGEQPMSYLDNMLSELNKLGMDQVCKEMTAKMK